MHIYMHLYAILTYYILYEILTIFHILYNTSLEL
jgi:hypothetical protein